jgi:hypothetical protein
VNKDVAHLAAQAQGEAPARTVQVHLRLTPFDYRRLTLLAEQRDQTLSATVRYLLRRHGIEAAGEPR